MASVKISERLYSDIVRNARRMVDSKLQGVIDSNPSIDMETIYDKIIGVQEQSVLSKVPTRYLNNIDNFEFGGFYNVPKGHKFGDTRQRQVVTNKVKRTWYQEENRGDSHDKDVGNLSGCKLNTSYSRVGLKCDWLDSRWDYLKTSYIEYCEAVHKQLTKNDLFVEDVKTVAENMSTVKKMVQAYPSMWDLVPQEDKDRANAKPEKRDTAQQVVEKLDIDTDSLTATITLDKITRGGNNNG